MTPQTLIIGLAGGTGSGKTTIAQELSQKAKDSLIILPQDAYYRAQDDLPPEVRALTNYDEPSAFDTELLIEHLDQLLAGEAIARPVYDFSQHNRASDTVIIQPHPVVIVEGILVLHDPVLRKRLRLKVFVDAAPDERFIRRLERDVRERGRNAESVIGQYRRSVKPMHDLFIEPSKQHADLIIPEGGSNSMALQVLSAFVMDFIHHKPSRTGS